MKQSPPAELKVTKPLFLEKTSELVDKLSKYSPKQLAKVLEVSQPLADLNYERLQNWQSTPKRPALWMYSGDVYNGIDAFSMNEKEIVYAQNKLLIVSGLYGLLRPLDEVQPYRLEMKLNFKVGKTRNLYEYWGSRINDYLSKTNEKTLLMCASKEYSKAVTVNLDDSIKVITPRFMQETKDGLKEKGLFAKFGRGLLARWIIDNQIDNPSKLPEFNEEGFVYSSDLSTEDEVFFIIPKDFSLKGRFVKR
jgi:cytoplasmic iron level regulating protein YaaA (DUF328/UPF0246 family)